MPFVSLYTLADACALATKHGGLFIGNTFGGVLHKHQWECAKKHTFTASFDRIRNKRSFCNECSGWNRERSIDDMKEIAASRNGFCLSETYRFNTPLQWKCERGHTWFALYSNVFHKNQWCRACSSFICERICREIFAFLHKKEFPSVQPNWLRSEVTGRPLQIDGYNDELKLGFEYQGLQHYQPIAYFGGIETFNDTVNRDACKKRLCSERGITLIEIPCTVPRLELYTFIRSHFPQLHSTTPETIDYYKDLDLSGTRSDLQIVKLQLFIDENYPGGKVLSTVFTSDNHEKMKFRCSRGHEFETTNGGAKTTFCVICNKMDATYWQEQGKQSLIDLQKSIDVIHPGGKVVSQVFSSTEKMDFVCKHGFQFSALVGNAKKRFVGCDVCRQPSWDAALVRLKEFVAVTYPGAQVLSTEFKENIMIKFQCKYGSIFEKLACNARKYFCKCEKCLADKSEISANATVESDLADEPAASSVVTIKKRGRPPGSKNVKRKRDVVTQ